jgi:hypothetical protein
MEGREETQHCPSQQGLWEPLHKDGSFQGHSIFLEKRLKSKKDDHILGREWLGSGSNIKEFSSKKGHDKAQTMLFRNPALRGPIYEGTAREVSPQEKVTLCVFSSNSHFM